MELAAAKFLGSLDHGEHVIRTRKNRPIKRIQLLKSRIHGPAIFRPANETSGREIGSAPRSVNSRESSTIWGIARVTTIFLPANGDGSLSATLAAHFFEDGLRAGFDQQTGHVFTKLPGLLRRCGRALFHVLRAVYGANASFHDQLFALDTRPRTKGYLTAALKRGKQRALRSNRSSCFGIVEARQHAPRFHVFRAAFDRDCSLTDRRHAHVR